MVVESSDHEDPRLVGPRWPAVWWWKANVEGMVIGSMVAKVREDGADFPMGKEGLASFQVGREGCRESFQKMRMVWGGCPNGDKGIMASCQL